MKKSLPSTSTAKLSPTASSATEKGQRKSASGPAPKAAAGKASKAAAGKATKAAKANKASKAAAPGQAVSKASKGKSPTWKAGLAVRSEVLGADYVARRFEEADSFNGDLQDFVTEHAWGAVWARPGLPRKTRSLLVLAMTCALNRPHELEIHVRGALNNGVTAQEMKELFLQVAVYCGAPASLDGFRVARKVLKEQGLL